ncbi:iron-containing alcohol dehydrogenase [Candidatus Omnitrophota bacterium]
MLNFKHYIPTIVYFGKGQVRFIKKELSDRGVTKLLIVTGQVSVKKNGIFDAVIKEVKAARIPYVELSGIKPNPLLKSVYKGIEVCKKENVDFILAVGGGSVIDAAKAIAAGAKYAGDVWDFFEHKAYPETALPLGTVLTLAATGSEMNGNSVVTKEETQRKLAFGCYVVRPIFSILDPEYTYTVDAYNTAAGVADIMVHVFEQYFSLTPASEVQDRLSEGLIKVCIKYGPIVVKDPTNYDARSNILWAGSLALNSLIGEGKSQDWATHAIEHEVSAIYDISHGVGLAILSPNWMKHVLSEKTVDKFVDFGVNVWGIERNKNKMVIAEEAIQKTRIFFTSLGLPSSLSEINISNEHFETMARGTFDAWGGAVGSFKELVLEDVIKIYEMSL